MEHAKGPARGTQFVDQENRARVGKPYQIKTERDAAEAFVQIDSTQFQGRKKIPNRYPLITDRMEHRLCHSPSNPFHSLHRQDAKDG
jgi:hypothetical protein